MNLKESDRSGISLLILNNNEPERWYILTNIFDIYLRESFFPDCWKVLYVVPVFKREEQRIKTAN